MVLAIYPSKTLTRELNMDLFEIIHIRSFGPKDREAAMQAFENLQFSNFNRAAMSMRLLQDVLLDTDLRIIIKWHGKVIEKAKSALGVQLAAAFTEFGRVHHIICKECDMSRRRHL